MISSAPPAKDRISFGTASSSALAPWLSHRPQVYIVQYRQGGRSPRLRSASWSLTPEEARREAKKFLGDFAGGADPVETRRKTRVASFPRVAREYIGPHVAAKRKKRTHEGYEALFRLHILPAIGSLPPPEIRHAHTSRMHARCKHPGAANRALNAGSAVWNWAVKQYDDLDLPSNPFAKIARNPEQGKERFLSGDELARLGDTLRQAETVGLPYSVDETRPKAKHAAKPESRFRTLDPYAVAAVRLLLLTGARLREILHARWAYVDFERGLLNLPDSKTGRKTIFLSAPALDVSRVPSASQ